MLGTLDAAEKHKWSQHISKLVHAYNCTKNEAMGYSPYFLLFGREARLPIDVCFGTSSGGGEGQTYQKYVEDLKTDLQTAYRLASETALKNNKRLYDQKVKYQNIEPGDRVLIRNLSFTGKHKLEDRWNSAPYIFLEKLDNLPIYKLKPEKGTGGVRTMHRDHLLHIGDSVRMPKFDERREVPQRPVTRSRAAKKQKEPLREKRASEPSEMIDNSSESEGESHGYYSQDWSRQWTPLIPDLQRKLEMKEDEVTAHTDSESQHSGEEEVIEETYETEDSRENIHQNVGWEEERNSEGGEKSSSTLSDSEAEPMEHRPKRQWKPVSKLSYDELGQPSERIVTVVHRGIIIHLPNSSKIKLCPPERYSSLPKCARCTRICADPENKLIIHI